MKRLGIVLTTFAIAGLAVSACQRDLTDPADRAEPFFSQAPSLQDQYIVVLNDDLDPSAVSAEYGVQASFTYRSALTGFSATLPAAARGRLANDPRVRWVEPVVEYQIHLAQQQSPEHHRPGHGGGGGGGGGGGKGKGGGGDPPPPPPPPPPPFPTCTPDAGDPNNNDLGAPGLYGITQVGAPQSNIWINEPVNQPAPSQIIDIAILDTGADLDHSDLCIHDAVSFDPFEPTPDDFHGHGTHTSGTSAARDDNGLVVGVAPEARIWVVKVCNSGGGCPSSAIVAGIDYVAANADQIEVANMSLGGSGSDQAHNLNPLDCGPISGDARHLSICNATLAGVTFVVSAGNSASDLANFSPATYDEVLTVTAINSSEQPASFTNFATLASDKAHTIAGPGVSVLSDWLNNTTATASGTSMSSPHAAGSAALFIVNYMNMNGGAQPTPYEVVTGLIADGRTWTGQGGNHTEPLLDVSTYDDITP